MWFSYRISSPIDYKSDILVNENGLYSVCMGWINVITVIWNDNEVKKRIFDKTFGNLKSELVCGVVFGGRKYENSNKFIRIFQKNRLLNVVQFWIDQVVWFFKNKSWKMLPRSQQFNLVTRTPVPIKPRNKKIIQFVFYNKKSDRYLRQRKSSPKSIPIFSLLEGFLIK